MRVLTAIDEGAVGELRARGEFFWLDLADASEADVDRLGPLFGLHPLALEDSRKFGQRPKLEEYDRWLLLVFYGAGPSEVHAYVSGEWVITLHRGEVAPLATARTRLEARDGAGEQFTVYAILDALTDSWFPALEAVDDELDRLEEAILAGDDLQERILALRRRIGGLRRIALPQRDLFGRATEQIMGLPGLEPGTRDYFRDVDDHLIRIASELDAFRDHLASLFDVHLSATSNRLNVLTTRLTLVATVFLPLTFLTGFFGQNFGWMVDRIDGAAEFWGLGVGLAVLSAALLVAWLRRQRPRG